MAATKTAATFRTTVFAPVLVFAIASGDPVGAGGKVCAPVLLLPIYNIRKVYPFSINKDECALLGTEYGVTFHRFFSD